MKIELTDEQQTSDVRGLIGKLAVNELSKVNPTAHTTLERRKENV